MIIAHMPSHESNFSMNCYIFRNKQIYTFIYNWFWSGCNAILGYLQPFFRPVGRSLSLVLVCPFSVAICLRIPWLAFRHISLECGFTWWLGWWDQVFNDWEIKILENTMDDNLTKFRMNGVLKSILKNWKPRSQWTRISMNTLGRRRRLVGVRV